MQPEKVLWVVNGLGELGVRIQNENFFLYKGGSLSYSFNDYDLTYNFNEDTLEGIYYNVLSNMWRHVGKREFGECCHPVEGYYVGFPKQAIDRIWPDFEENGFGEIKEHIKQKDFAKIADILPGDGWHLKDKLLQDVKLSYELKQYLASLDS